MKKNIQILALLLIIRLNASAQLANWTPGSNSAYTNYPTYTGGQINGFCRITQFKFHSTNPNKMYAVTAQGGLFTTTDGGNNWTVKQGTESYTGFNASLCIDYTNDQTIYMGTGDPDYYTGGDGIFKSTDGGTTFTPTTLTDCLVLQIIQSPTSAGTFVAATDKGIYKSTDNGATWNATTSTSIRFEDLKANAATNSQILYACTNETTSRFFRSIDYGSTWAQVTSGITTATTTAWIQSGGRIGVTPADPNTVYFDEVGGLGMIFKSTDGGLNFTLKKGEGAPNLVSYDSTIADGVGQGNYNNCITVDRTDPTKLWYVSHCMWSSSNSGAAWTFLHLWVEGIHTDAKQITESPFNPSQLWASNDGGMWLSTDGGVTFTPKSNGLYAYEIANYAGKGSHTNRENVVIGTQDNGRIIRSATQWTTIGGGDDYEAKEFDYLPNGGYFYNLAHNDRTSTSDVTSTYGLPKASVQQIAFNRTNPQIAFMGDSGIYRTTNLGAVTPAWTLVFPNLLSISALHSCIADTNRLYFITQDMKFNVCTNAMGSTPTFTSYTLPTSFSAINTVSIAALANNADIVYVSLNDVVMVSTNAGVSWTDITYNLPPVNHRRVLTEEYGGTQGLVFVATNNAVYYKKIGQITWTNYSTNLPARRPPTDFSMYDDGSNRAVIRYASFGRAIWESSFSNLRVPTAAWTANATSVCPGIGVQFNDLSVGFTPTSWSWSFPGGSPSTSTSQNPVISYAAGGTTNNVTLTASDGVNTSTVTKNNYITTFPLISLPYSEGMEGTTFAPANLLLGSTTAQYFTQSTTVGGFGLSSKSASFINWGNNGQQNSTIATITTNPIVLKTGATSSIFSFDVAYSIYYSPFPSDTMTVSISADCGSTYTELYRKNGHQLSTNGGVDNFSNSFVPTASEWRKDSINLGAYSGQTVKIQIKHIVLFGNNLYLDNLNVSQTGVALPVQLLSFTVKNIDNSEALLNWNVAQEVNLQKYVIERSVDGVNFSQIGSVAATASGAYSFNDPAPIVGTDYYRIKMVDLDGKFTYSEMKTAVFNSKIMLTIVPNPTRDGLISFMFNGLAGKSDLTLTITNSLGELIHTSSVHNVLNNTKMPANLGSAAGVYFVQLTLSSGERFIRKVIVEK